MCIEHRSTEYDRIIQGDCIEALKGLPDGCVHTCVSSPPYWMLRNYGMVGQMGLEETPELYVKRMVEVFREVKRVLREDGTLWLNIGDSYAATGKNRTEEQACRKSNLTGGKAGQIACAVQPSKIVGDLKAKDLVGIPWMLAFALRADGWYLRMDIIWSKPNPMPESVTDRPTKAHEYIFLLSKSPKYYYDAEAIKTPGLNPADDLRRLAATKEGARSNPDDMKNGLRPKSDKQRGHSRRHAGFSDRWDNMTTAEQCSMGANKRSVWTVPTRPFAEAHFATFPPDLITDCIKAGCPEGGLVLDPFMGAGTTAVVAKKLGRHYIGAELNPEYIAITENRLRKELGLFQ